MSVDIEKICRTCLALSGPLLSIYDNNGSGTEGCLADMLSSFTKNRPLRADNLPEKVCLSCISEINRCYSFKLKCENSNRTLRQMLPGAAILEDDSEKPKPEKVHKSSQTAARQTANVEVQTTLLEMKKPTPPTHVEMTDKATLPLTLKPPSGKGKAHLDKKLKLERNLPTEIEEFSAAEEMEDVEYITDKPAQPTPIILKQECSNVSNATNCEELILEMHNLSETDVDVAEVLLEEEEVLETESNAVEEANNEDNSSYYDQHYVYDEIEEEITPKEASQQTYYVQEVAAHVDDDDNDNDNGNEELEDKVNGEEVDGEEFELIENTNEDEVDNDEMESSKDPDYNFTIYNNVYGEEEIRPKRNRAKYITGKRVSHKCPECVMAFISIKTLARHMMRQHSWSHEQAHQVVTSITKEKKAPSKEMHSVKPAVEQQAMDVTEVDQENGQDQRGDEDALLTLPHSMQATLLEQLREEIELDKKEASSNSVKQLSAVIVDPGQSPSPGEFPYSCERCKGGFRERKSLNYHRKLNICGAPSYKCSECSRVFISQKNLDEHKAQHILSNVCIECNGVFETAEALSEHMVQKHNRKIRNQCPICKKVFTMYSALRDHERVHSGEKPYHCTTCGKSFSQNANLKQHVMRHFKEKRFKCEHCSNSYVTKSELYSHTRTHTGDHPYRCEYCDTTYTSQSSLTKHKRKHTGERPYACDLCPMRFTALNVLKNHRRTHTGERPYKCTFCKQAFTQRGDCVIHQRTHTGNRRARGCKAAATQTAKQNADQITIVNVDDDDSVMVEETQNSAETGDEELIEIAMDDM